MKTSQIAFSALLGLGFLLPLKAVAYDDGQHMTLGIVTAIIGTGAAVLSVTGFIGFANSESDCSKQTWDEERGEFVCDFSPAEKKFLTQGLVWLAVSGTSIYLSARHFKKSGVLGMINIEGSKLALAIPRVHFDPYSQSLSTNLLSVRF